MAINMESFGKHAIRYVRAKQVLLSMVVLGLMAYGK